MSAANQLRFGVVGLTSDHVWGMGDGLAALPEVELVGAADPHAELRERSATQWGLSATFDDAGPLLETLRPDAILVCCDNAAKPDVVAKAAAHGVHVYQDKPMAATLEQARRSAKAARAAGITLMVAYHRAFDPTYHEVGQLIRQGAIGTLYLARGAIGHGGPKEFGCSHWFYDWLFDAAQNGGGSFVDEGCYLVDQLVDQVGPVAEVSGFTAQMGVRDYLPKDVEDNAVAVLRFASGALGVLDAKWGQVGPAPILVSFHGTGGTLTNYPGRWELYSTTGVEPPPGWEELEADAGGMHGGRPASLRRWHKAAPPRGGAGRGGAEQRYFVDHVMNKEPVDGAAGIDVALHAQAVIQAFYESARSGCAVKVAAG